MSPPAVAVDASGVYWLDLPSNGTDLNSVLRRIPAGGTMPVVVAAHAGRAPGSLALDANCASWADGGTQAIYRGAK